MNTDINIDLKKITAVTTLFHLCTLEQLEKFVNEVKKAKP